LARDGHSLGTVSFNLARERYSLGGVCPSLAYSLTNGGAGQELPEQSSPA